MMDPGDHLADPDVVPRHKQRLRYYLAQLA